MFSFQLTKENIDSAPGGYYDQVIINSGAFTQQNYDKAGYTSNPMEDGSLSAFRVHSIDISKLTATALAETGLSAREIGRAKNMFALGLMLWMYSRPMEQPIKYIEDRQQK